MKRLIRGMIGLSLVAGLSACDSDPSLDFGGEPTLVQANPSVMFITQGARKEVLVRLVNDRNQSIPAQFETSNIGSGITVALDEAYRPNNIEGYLDVPAIKEQHRYYVTANSAVSTTFTISNGSLSTQVQVNVIPTAIPITFGSTTPIFGSLSAVDITAPDFVFTMATRFDFDGIVVAPLSVSADGHTATIIAPPGQSGVVPTISGARASYMPGVPLSATAGSAGLTTPAGPFGATTAAAAPTIIVPADGVSFVDVGVVSGPDTYGGGGPLIWYKLSIAEARLLDVTVDWSGPGADVDFGLCSVAACTMANDIGGAFTSAHPEHFAANVPAGDVWLVVLNWSNLAPVETLTITIH